MVLLLATTDAARAAFERLPGGARAGALCGALPVSSREPLAGEANPAFLAGSPGPAVELAFVPGLFGLTELRQIDCALTVPLPPGAAGFQARGFGGPLYRELSLSAAAAASLVPGCDLGLGLTLYHLSIPAYGSAAALGVNLGVRVQVAGPVLFALSASNLNRPVLGKSCEPIGAGLQAFLQYDPAQWIHLMTAVWKAERESPSAAAGVEADLAGCLTIRAGLNESGSQYGLGASIALAGVQLDYGAVVHLSLGLTQSFSLTLQLPPW